MGILLLDFHFSTASLNLLPGFLAPENSRGGGTVGISRTLRDSQGRWEGWKTCLRFSRLSTARHFHSLALYHANRGGTGDSLLHCRNSWALAAPIFLADSVSLIAYASLSSPSSSRNRRFRVF